MAGQWVKVEILPWGPKVKFFRPIQSKVGPWAGSKNMVFRVVRPAFLETWSVEVNFGMVRQRLLEARVEQTVGDEVASVDVELQELAGDAGGHFYEVAGEVEQVGLEQRELRQGNCGRG